MKLSVIIAFLIITVSITSGDDAQVYCGRRLARTLAMYCEYSEEMVKKSMPNSLEYNGQGWLQAAKAFSMGGSRGKRGVVDECCYKPCSLDELLSYC